MLKLRDDKIKKLTAEIAELKGRAGGAPAAAEEAPAKEPPAATPTKGANKPAAAKGGGKAAQAPKPVPLIQKAATKGGEMGTSIRGAARGRGGAAAAGASKRKREGDAGAQEAQAGGDASKGSSSKKSKGGAGQQDTSS